MTEGLSETAQRAAVVGSFFNQAAGAGNTDSLTEIFESVGQPWGFGAPTYFSIGNHQGYISPHYLFGRRVDSWMTRYAEKAYARSDVLAAMCTWAGEPFTWSEVEAARSKGPHLLMLAEARELLAPEMAVCPVHTSGGGIDAVAVPLEQRGRRLDAGEKKFIYSLASIYAVFGRTLCGPDLQPPEAAVTLTKREHDCLYWVSIGKSDAEIAKLLQISSNTVHHQIESAKAKLGVYSRILLVRRAAAAGLIAKPD